MSFSGGVRGEAGAALLLVVVALALLGAMAVGAFATARLERRSASDLVYATEAFEAAESGLAWAAAGWDSTVSAGPPGVPRIGPSVVKGRMRFTPVLTRLNATLYFIVVTGERLDGEGNVLARRVLGLVGKSPPPGAGGAGGFVPLAERSWVQLYE